MPTVSEDGRDLAALVAAARSGDARALEALLRALVDPLYRLCLRMSASAADAEDATQEVLLKVTAGLGRFRGEAAVTTWAHRIALNHLLDRRKSSVEALGLDFDRFAADLRDGQQPAPADADPLLAEEVKLGCTLAMLTCLDRGHRAAYVLGEVFDLPPAIAADVQGVSEQAHRQRLSRARRQLEAFTHAYCGLVGDAAACRCDRRVARALETGRVSRARFAFVPAERRRAEQSVAEMQRLHDAAALFRSHPEYRAPERIVQTLTAALSSGELKIPD